MSGLPRRTLLKAGVLSGAAILSRQVVAAPTDETEPANPLLSYGSSKTTEWQVGIKVQTKSTTCTQLYATFPVPVTWPEQTIQIADQEISEFVTAWKTRDLDGGARQVLVQMRNIPPNTQANALFTFQVDKQQIKLNGETTDLVVPKRLDRSDNRYMGSSPYIDPRHARIRKVLEELNLSDDASAWNRVEMIFDWVRDNIQYREGNIKTAVEALADGFGDCEELTSLFVALCRASRIPARVVWIPGHCYPEFMLHDSKGDALWFPCQAAGTRQFGEMDEHKPILQKGDRFKVPEKKTLQRYVSEYCTLKSRVKPSVEFVRDVALVAE